MNLLTILDSIPNPWNWRFLALTVGASVVATIAACMRADSTRFIAGIVVLAISVAVVIVGRSIINRNTGSASNHTLRLIAGPILLGIPPIVTAVAMGDPGAGGYPAVLSILLGYVVFTTRDIEHRAVAESDGREDYPVHTIYHSTLAWISTVFFFFGVATLWPWLGHIYNGGYFWILVIGVLMPTLYLWGRLRQPRGHHSLAALVRFNRTLPYIGLILLLAILVG